MVDPMVDTLRYMDRIRVMAGVVQPLKQSNHASQTSKEPNGPAASTAAITGVR